MYASWSTVLVDRAGVMHIVHAGRSGDRSTSHLADKWTEFSLL